MESCTEDEMVMTRKELQDWIKDRVEKSKLLDPAVLKLKSLLERREKQTAALFKLCRSLQECEATMKKLYTVLGWEYRDTESEDEGQCSRTSVFIMDEKKDDGNAVECDDKSQIPQGATPTKIVGPSSVMPDCVTERSRIVNDVKKTERHEADFSHILRRRPVVVLTKLSEHQLRAALRTLKPQQSSSPEEALHTNESEPNWVVDGSESLALSPDKPKKKRRHIEEDLDSNDSDPSWDVEGAESFSSGSDYEPEKKKQKQNKTEKLAKTKALTPKGNVDTKNNANLTTSQGPPKNNNIRATTIPSQTNAKVPEVATKRKCATVQSPIRVAVVTTISQASTTAKELPRIIKEENVMVNMKVLVQSESKNWQKGQICEIINDEGDRVRYKVNCDETGMCTVPGHRIAFYHPASVDQLYVGVRVVAMYQKDNKSWFYAGVLAELPSRKNRMRFLVFFDDHNAAYMGLPNIRLVCRPLKDVCEHILDSGLKDFIKDYLNVWPHPPMVSYNVGEKINVDYEGVVKRCTVDEIDSSLMCVVSDNEHKEWIYRGSIRLENMVNMKKTMEHVAKNGDKQGSQPKADFTKQTIHNNNPQAASTTTPKLTSPSIKATKTENEKKVDGPTSTMVGVGPSPHDCSPDCLNRIRPKDDMESHRGRNPLILPLLYEFRRLKKAPKGKSKSKSSGRVNYRAPCGLTLNNMAEVEKYLDQTGCNFLYLDMFCMDPCVSVTNSYNAPPSKLHIPDLANRKENQPVPCFNEQNHIRPSQMLYSRDRVAGDGISIHSGSNLVGCKCTDGCRNSKACSCRQLSIQKTALSPGGKEDSSAGYMQKRLNGCIITGVYECNALCGCDPRMCSNRVVQHGVQLRLQVFMTCNKGWGIRCLDNVTKGTFVCTFSGRVENDDKNHVNSYCAKLNYIEAVTNHKESKVTEPEPMKRAASEVKKPTKSTDHKKKTRANTRVTATTASNLFDGKKSCYVIDASMEGNVAHYLNHSCSPNLFGQYVFVDTHDPRLPCLAFFTNKLITSGTELTWDYRSVIGGIKGVSGQMQCRCGSKNCQGKL